MKNYLLKIACLSILCFGLFMISCSESDNEDSSDDSTDNGETTTELTDECLTCPGFDFYQNGETIVYLQGKVCKGEDGKAYYENGDPVDELGQTFEDHIEFLGTQARFCE